MQAIRAHLRAGHTIRAANLALRLRGRHGDDAEAARMAGEVLAAHAPQFFQLEVDCAECTLEIDGRVWSYTGAIVEPGTEHRVVVQRGDARRVLRVRGERGERRVIEAPEATRATSGPSELAADRAEPPVIAVEAPPARARMPLPAWLFGIGVGLTAGALGALIWSGVDTLSGVDAYNAMPTWEAFYEGEEKEARTNVLIGVTLGLAALTALAAVLTDWEGERPLAIGLVLEPTTIGGTATWTF